jgi:carbonic anhydrase
MVHRTPAAILPPYGTVYPDEQALIDRAVRVHQVRDIVICGHADCRHASHLRMAKDFAVDFVLRSWLAHAESARRTLAELPSPDDRSAVEHCLLAQQTNLMTYPMVASATARSLLRVWVWIYDPGTDELLYPAAGETRFRRPVALHPEQNAGLCRDFIRRPRQQHARNSLDPRSLGMA